MKHMSDFNVPVEQLTAYQRWELPSFDAHETSSEPIPVLPTAAEIEEIQRQAHEEGFQLGQEEGFHSGYQEGAQKSAEEARKLAAETERLRALIDTLGQQVDTQVTQQLLELSLELAKQMLHQALHVQPALILPVVQEAISALPPFSSGAHVVLHPDDAALVRAQLGEQLAHSGWKIFEDMQISPGGARIETSHSQIDASLETRWKRVLATLGQDTSWLLP